MAMKCPHCGNDDPYDFTFDGTVTTTAPAGALSHLHEIQTIVTIGCDVCSETLLVEPLGRLLDFLLNEWPSVLPTFYSEVMELNSSAPSVE